MSTTAHGQIIYSHTYIHRHTFANGLQPNLMYAWCSTLLKNYIKNKFLRAFFIYLSYSRSPPALENLIVDPVDRTEYLMWKIQINKSKNTYPHRVFSAIFLGFPSKYRSMVDEAELCCEIQTNDRLLEFLCTSIAITLGRWRTRRGRGRPRGRSLLVKRCSLWNL